MKKILFISMVIVLLCAMASCQKDQNINSSQPIETVEPSPVESGEPELKITSSQILNATNASQIPSQFFDSYLEYKAWYQHQKQPNSTSCSWTSYVNCIGTIVRGASANMTQYTTSISTVKYRCTNYYPQVNAYGSNSIMALNWHAGAYDGSKINYQLQSTSNRFTAIKYMLAHSYTFCCNK